jgi:hypothetical protein
MESIMSQEKRDAITAEIIRFTRRLEELTEQVVPGPMFWPPRGGSAGYRRMARRLRSGELPSPDPDFISAEDLADYLDLCVEQKALWMTLAKESREFAEWLTNALDDLVGEVWEQAKDLYKVAKKMAEVQGPESGPAKFCKDVQNIWRETQGEHKGRSRRRTVPSPARVRAKA